MPFCPKCGARSGDPGRKRPPHWWLWCILSTLSILGGYATRAWIEFHCHGRWWSEAAEKAVVLVPVMLMIVGFVSNLVRAVALSDE